MTKTDQLRVSGNPRSLNGSGARTLASLVLSLTLSFPAWAQDGGVVSDAPRIVKLANGHYDFNPPAYVTLDAEVTRLQQVERVHKAEPSWATPVLIGMALGALAGATTVGALWWASSAVAAPKTSP